MKRICLLAAAFLSLAYGAPAQAQMGCASAPSSIPDITGTYLDNYGGLQAILEKYWVSGRLVFETCSVDNAKKRVIAWNGLRDPYNPGKFSRFEWLNFKGRLWYCQSVFNAASETDAEAASPADPSDPRIGGCGQFEWSTLIRIGQ